MQTLRAWLPALAGMTCLGLGPGLISLFGFFVEPVATEFSVGVATVNIAPVALLLVPGIIAPMVGRLVDNWPIRRMLLGGSAFAMVSLFAVSQSSTLWQAGLGFLGFAIGITFYGPVVVNGLMVKLYAHQQGRALAIAALGISVASATLPPVIGATLAWLDWRQTLAAMSLSLLVVLWLWVWLAIPRAAGAGPASVERAADRGFYRQPQFWLVGTCVALTLNVMVILAICYPPLFATRDFSVIEAGLFLAMAGIAGALGKLTVALLADVFRPHASFFAAGLLSLQLAGMLLLLQAGTTVLVAASVALIGFSAGAFLPIHPYLNSRYFPAEVIGQVNGAQAPLFLPLGLTGPPLAGYVYDRTGSYDLVLAGLAGVLLVAVITVLLLPRSRF
ncbi:MFS transporter [Seongchinamella sediminis]|uniref:MFS transporter n=1 Tax=Seongchinamella sediminis TaxID=2283635 RepID=A0A3L7E3G3_9GAMM|nr:MFS transporter [Seongchinamella sediminis]RLQ23400.1 MFS transporter [Seongchinamella sediminis]